MAAYQCDICSGVFCSHDVNYYHCEKCNTTFCETCWMETLHDDQELDDEICGDCYEALSVKAAELTEGKEPNEY